MKELNTTELQAISGGVICESMTWGLIGMVLTPWALCEAIGGTLLPASNLRLQQLCGGFVFGSCLSLAYYAADYVDQKVFNSKPMVEVTIPAA